MQPLVDIYIVYQLVKRLVTPFEDTAAYKLGIIDQNGLVLKPKSSLKTSAEKQAWTWIDILVNNIKRIFARFPGGRSKFFGYAASYFMLREPISKLREASELSEDMLLECILGPQSDNYLMEAADLAEDGAAPAMSAGSGAVAGIGVGPQGEPGIYRPKTFAGCRVFEVDAATFQKCRFGKKKYARYEQYVGTGPIGEDIKNYGRKYRKKGIILMDAMTGSMFYLRRPRV